METSEGLGPTDRAVRPQGAVGTAAKGRTHVFFGRATAICPMWGAGPELPGVQIFFFFSGEARDLTFFVFNLLIVEFVNIGK